MDVDKSSFKLNFKRILRQLDERSIKVSNGQRPKSYYQYKRNEFIELIDSAIKQGWFIMPKSSTRIWKIYHNKY
jgi:hypothetical protein